MRGCWSPLYFDQTLNFIVESRWYCWSFLIANRLQTVGAKVLEQYFNLPGSGGQ